MDRVCYRASTLGITKQLKSSSFMLLAISNRRTWGEPTCNFDTQNLWRVASEVPSARKCGCRKMRVSELWMSKLRMPKMRRRKKHVETITIIIGFNNQDLQENMKWKFLKILNMRWISIQKKWNGNFVIWDQYLFKNIKWWFVKMGSISISD